MAAILLGPQGSQLAYSEVDEIDDGCFPAGGAPPPNQMPPLTVDPGEADFADDAAVSSRTKVSLLGSAVAAVVTVGFAALALSVAIGIGPTTNQQAIRTLFVLTGCRPILGVALVPRVPPMNRNEINAVFGNDLSQQITSTFDVTLSMTALALLAGLVSFDNRTYDSAEDCVGGTAEASGAN